MAKNKASIEQKLDEVFGVLSAPSVPGVDQVPEIKALIPVVEAPLVHTTDDQDKDREDDFAVVRQVMHDLVVQGKDLANSALFFAKERQDPRSIEAATAAMKETRDNVLALMDIHRTRKDLAKQEIPVVKGSGDTYNQQIVLNGTTSELLKMMREIPPVGELADQGKPEIADNTPFRQPKSRG